MRPYRINPRLRRRSDISSLEAWVPLLVRLDWAQRLVVLEHIDDQLQREFGMDRFKPLSQAFVAHVIEHLGAPPPTCREQALVYLNSSAPAHVQAARVFLNAPD